MNSPAHFPPTPAERRQRLALACELDRLRLRLALRPAARPPELTVGGVPLSALGADLFRAFNPCAR